MVKSHIGATLSITLIITSIFTLFHKTGLYSNTFKASPARLMAQNSHYTCRHSQCKYITSLIFKLTWNVLQQLLFNSPPFSWADICSSRYHMCNCSCDAPYRIAYVMHPIELLLGLLRFMISIIWPWWCAYIYWRAPRLKVYCEVLFLKIYHWKGVRPNPPAYAPAIIPR